MRNAIVASIVALACLAGFITAAAKRRGVTVTNFSFSPSSFAVAPPTPSGAGHAGGTTIRFRVSASALITIAIDRKLSGRKSGRRCVKPTHRLRQRSACSRYVAAGTTSWTVRHAGHVAIPFSGRIGGQALQPGAYRARIVAIRQPRRGGGLIGEGSPPTAMFMVTGSPAPPQQGTFPGPSTTGTPAGWTPTRVSSTDVHVRTPGAVVQNLRLTNGADLYIDAPNVTVKYVDVQGGSIRNCDNWFGGSAPCEPGLLVEDATIELAAGQTADPTAEPAIWLGNYKAVRVKVWRRSAGFYVGNKSGGAGPVEIDNSYVNLVDPNNTGSDPLHSEALQCYDGPAVTLNNNTFDTTDASHGTSSFFCPSGQGNTSAIVNGLLAMNGSNDRTSSNYNCCGYVFRDGVPGTVTNLNIVNHTWSYGAIAVTCSLITQWQAHIVNIDRTSGGTSTAPYNVTRVLRSQRCDTQDGN